MATSNTNKQEKTFEKVTYISVRKKPWKDLQDNDYVYKQGDCYPREGLEVSPKRIKELSTINNKIGEILIQKVESEESNKIETKKDKKTDDTKEDNELGDGKEENPENKE